MAIQLNHRNNSITTGVNAETPGINLDINNTGSLVIPRGTNAQRPTTPVPGMFRFNTSTNVLEFYNGTSWTPVYGGNTEDLLDSNGNFIVDGISVGGTVANYVTVTNASATQDPEIAVQGTDTNIDLVISAKGTGLVSINNVATFGPSSTHRLNIRGESTRMVVDSTQDLTLRGNDVTVELSSVSNSFRVSQGSTNALSVFASGSNGLTIEAGGSEARLRSNSGGLFIESTGTNNVRIGNGTTFGLIVDAQVSGSPLIVKTQGSGPVITASEYITINSSADRVSFANARLTEVANPTQPQDAATKSYVDAAINGLDWKQSVRVATGTDIDLSGLFAIDGVSIASGDRVLVKAQVSAQYNGIYIAQTGSWIRAEDADQDSEVTAGFAVFVEEGNTYGDTGWVLITNDPIVVGTTELQFTQFTGAGSFTLFGGLGIKTSASGTVWEVEADVDNSTIWASAPGNKLAVFAPDSIPQYSVLIAPTSAGPAGRSAVWGKVNLSTSNAVDGTLQVGHGGTGLSSVANQALLVGTGTSALAALAVGTPSTSALATVLTVNSSGNVAWGNLTLDQLSDVNVGGAVAGDILTFNGTEWVPASGNVTDTKVAVSSSTTPGYLSDVLLAATSGAVQFTTVGNTMNLRVRYDDVTLKLVSNDLSVAGGASNQVLLGAGTNAAATWGYLDSLYNNTGTALFTVTGTGTQLSYNSNTNTLSLADGNFNITTASGNVVLNGVTYPNNVPPRSVLVTNSAANVLIPVTASAGNYQILRWNNTLGNFEFVPQDSVAQNAFSTVLVNGNISLEADALADTLNINQGNGITITATSATDTLTITFSKNGMSDTAVTSAFEVVFFDGSNNPQYRSFANAFNDLNVAYDIVSNGLVTRTGVGSFSARSIVAATSPNLVGINVTNGDGVAGNPTVGLNLDALAIISGDTLNNTTDYVVVYRQGTSANTRVSVGGLINATVDKTRINDTPNITYVDTDEVSGSVVIASQGQYVATFNGGTFTSTEQYFNFDVESSAGVIRLEALGSAADISIRLVPAGNGQVLIGDVGDGVLQSENGYNLILAAGTSGNVIIKAGSTNGTTDIYTASSALHTRFNNDHSTTQFASNTNSYVRDYVFRSQTVGSATSTYSITIPDNSTVFVESYIVGRSDEDPSQGGGYKLKGVIYEASGATIMDNIVQEVIAENPNGLNTFITVSGKDVIFNFTSSLSGAVNWTAFVKMVTII